MIKAENVTFEYDRLDEEGNIESKLTAVDHLSLEIEPGSFIAVLGHNGSGKSTFAKHINALLTPTEGTLWVNGMDTKDEEHLWDIRQNAGMVFQNPDNQIIGTIVEEDVGFGPENLGVPTDEIWTARGREPGCSRHAQISSSFPKQIIRWTEAAGSHCRCDGYASEMYCNG